jgi:coenzyme Q-binding protein COQ10
VAPGHRAGRGTRSHPFGFGGDPRAAATAATAAAATAAAAAAAEDALQRTHAEEAVLFPYPAALVLHVVTDVGNYKHFVPWCVDSRVLPRGADTRAGPAGAPNTDTHTEFMGELAVGFNFFVERYTSRVTITRDAAAVAAAAWPATVTAEAQGTGLFKVLRNRWVLRPGPSGAESDCLLDFYVDFRFQAEVYAHASGLFMDEVVANMNAAFLQRCGDVEGAWRRDRRDRRDRARVPAAAHDASAAGAAASTEGLADEKGDPREPPRRCPERSDEDGRGGWAAAGPCGAPPEDALEGWPGGGGSSTRRGQGRGR